MEKMAVTKFTDHVCISSCTKVILFVFSTKTCFVVDFVCFCYCQWIFQAWCSSLVECSSHLLDISVRILINQDIYVHQADDVSAAPFLRCFISCIITFRIWHSQAKCIVIALVCVCLSVSHCIPTLLHVPGCNLRNGRGCPIVVHYWAYLELVHRFHCYHAKCEMSPQMLVLAVWLVLWMNLSKMKAFLPLVYLSKMQSCL